LFGFFPSELADAFFDRGVDSLVDFLDGFLIFL
jgi:hypothetical protein